jgi:glyoxylase-like metal-dependent hydrolase (beta-lactamase superfamily II)
MKIKRFEFNMFPVNCYVLWDETRQAVIIDPGCYNEKEREMLRSFIAANELTVTHLLNTHLHLDHIFGDAWASEQYGVPVEAHRSDEFWIESAPEQSRMFGFKWTGQLPKVGHYLHDTDLVSFGNTRLSVIHVPGHSPGSIVFYCAEAGALFTGDVLFQGSIGRADLAGGNFDELKEGICSRLFCLSNDTVVYPGHGAPTTIGIEKAENPFFRN